MMMKKLSTKHAQKLTAKSRMILASILALFYLVLSVGQVNAGLKICNGTSEVQSVSVGYEGVEKWTSEGWWVLEPTKCATVIGGDLDKQFYYFRAEMNGGEFEGGNFYFCTNSKEYTIVGDTNCSERGFAREDFYQIDTGNNSNDFTFTMNDQNTVQVSKDAGLRFCNETGHTQSVSVGYEGSEAWTSEGWWVLKPGECKMTIRGKLKNTYYYRAEVDGGDFNGDSYYFCTTPSEYTILGDKDCTGRGYDRESFALIDTSRAASVFTLTMTP